jgi:glycosyltransferase involved in cell wall biosynthesis
MIGTHRAQRRHLLQQGPLRVCLWSSLPTHHQSAFFAALREVDIELRVIYLEPVTEERLRLGWSQPSSLPADECYLADPAQVDAIVAEHAHWLHVVPGIGRPALRGVVRQVVRRGTPWVHWSEPAQASPSLARRAVRRVYAELVNRTSLGALAIGELARADFVRWGIRPGRIRFLPYSVAGFALRTPGPHGSAVRFLQAGVLCPRKGTDVLLDAFASVSRRCPGVRLSLVGNDTSGGAYRDQADRLGLRAAVEFTGAVPVEQLATHFAGADVAVLASRFDGWGVVLNEGASCGLPIVATDAAGAAYHLVEHGANGYRVPAGDAAALAAAMERYAREPDLVTTHGQRSRQIYEGFTPAAAAQRFRNAVASLAESRA